MGEHCTRRTSPSDPSTDNAHKHSTSKPRERATRGKVAMKREEIVERGRRVLRLEQEALAALEGGSATTSFAPSS